MNKDESKAYQKKYYNEHKAQMLAYAKEYRKRFLLENDVNSNKWWELTSEEKIEWEHRKHNKKPKILGSLRSAEFPTKNELDLGCYPQLPLVDVNRFKKIRG